MVDRRNFNFFRENAGYCVGRRAKGALALAKAEQEMTARNWYCVWVDDLYPDLSFMPEEDKASVQEVLCCALYTEEGACVASLSGIIDPDHSYRRVVEAELAIEALSCEDSIKHAA